MIKNLLPTDYQQFIYKSRYARWLDDKNRRENYDETVERYFSFFEDHLKTKHGYELPDSIKKDLEQAILGLRVMPSMRCLMTAGEALKRDNIAGYNCSYIPIDHPKAFPEILHILANGTGVGFSVERQYVNKLPEVPEQLFPTDTVIVVHDSKIGWAKSYYELIQLLYSGVIPTWDVSKVRPSGSRLKTFGGRASGPDPLVRLFKFTVQTFKNSMGRRLTSLEAHDIVCMVGEVIVSGGVRRSALISLSNLSDDRMRMAKSGQWWDYSPQRRISNNSAVYTDAVPSMEVFMSEWKSLFDSKSGERGIFSRWASQNLIDKNNQWRRSEFGEDVRFRELDWEWGCNPCSEIILRPNQFCNLSEVVVRPEDGLDDLKEKVRLATILGTFQSTLTDFKYISKKWRDNTESERLLGVSLTGVMDHRVLSGQDGYDVLQDWLVEMKKTAVEINTKLASEIGIPASSAITCVKPSGTVSQLVNSSSGIHARFSQYYLRTIRADKKDPLTQFMINSGFYVEDDVMAPETTSVIYFPIASKDTIIDRNGMSAIEQLDLWKIYQQNWCEHKPSITVYVREDEWMKVGAWVYENFNIMSGISFLPYSDHVYQQAPYSELSKDEYEGWMKKMPGGVDWSEFDRYESDDNTTSSQEMACFAGGCEI